MTEERKSRWFRRFLYGCGSTLIILGLAWQLRQRRYTPSVPPSVAPGIAAPTLTPQSTATPPLNVTPGITATPPVAVDPAEAAAAPQMPPGLQLIIPVANVPAAQLRDTYTEARTAGRQHNAIDIMAPQGTPVLAAADGQIVKFFMSERGGITLYQLSRDQRVVFYYAHLQRYAEGAAEGRVVRQGETIAYVGDTGNAGTGNYHLHFGVWLITDPKHYWAGANLNPYLLLKQAP